MKRPWSILVALVLSSPVCAGGNKQMTLSFEVWFGMPVITVQTSQGEKLFVLDTGSAISSMDIKRDKELNVSVAGKQFTVRFRPTQTKVFYEFEALLPPGKHVDGILGNDFMRHFRHVDFNFKDCVVTFD
jgi:hypothetical protein